MSNYLLRISTSILFTSALAAGAVTPNIERSQRAQADRWADSVYATLSDRERIAQLMFVKVVPTQGDASKAAVRRYFETDGCGGLLLTEGTLAQHTAIGNYAQEVAKVPVMITFDGEWGLSMRITDSPRFPHNMALGAIDDYKLLYRYGQEVAREFRLAGVHVNFAPDADVNSNPSNPVIGYRAFGEDPERVAKASTAYSLGLEDGGVQAVAKHFPGHGDTDSDSHKTLPVVNHTRTRLDSTDLVPFADFIGAGCSGVMVGHIAIPALDASGCPASLSALVTDKLLRREMGFEGLIYTDALGMKGSSEYTAHPALAALKAGADVLLCPTNAKAEINAIEAALRSGEISHDIVEEHCKRVLRYKYYYKAWEPAQNDSQLSAKVNGPEAEALINDLAAASITVLENRDNLLPLDIAPGQRISVVNIGENADNNFTSACRHYAMTEAHYTMGDAFGAHSLAQICNADVVVAAVYTDTPQARQAFAQIAAKAGKCVGVFFVNPYKMKKFAASLGSLDGLVLAYDNIAAMQTNAAAALFGGIATRGKLPVALRGVAPLGKGIQLPKTRLGFSTPVAEGFAPWLTDSIDAMVNKGLRTGAFPGCQVLVARNGNIIFDKAYGKLTSGGASVTPQTIYDLASVSKAVGTLPGIMKAYDTGLVKLDDNLGNLIPEITDTAKQCITVRQLLYHETGMPASLNVFDAMFDTLSYKAPLTRRRPDRQHGIRIQKGLYGASSARLRTDILGRQKSDKFPIQAAKGIFTGKSTYDTLMHRIYDIKLRDNRNYNYSCLNFCLLMDIEQRVTGRKHDEYVATEIFGPLGAYRTGYRPNDWAVTGSVAPTEHDTFMRRQTLKGYVHDELAAMSGGVQGNAGLFGNADDVAKYCQMLLNGGTYGGHRLLSEATANLFTTDKSSTCRRGLGFDKPDTENPDYSPTCDEASPAVFGHLGFTGTVFWVDPSENLIFVFLTNRVNPTRDNAAFNLLPIRPRLFSYVYRALNDNEDAQ